MKTARLQSILDCIESTKLRIGTQKLGTYYDDNGDDLPACNMTVLVVEDDAQVRGVICETLRFSGYTVLEAANGVEGVELARAYTKGPIHLLITDIVMPFMSGKELGERISIIFPEIKILFTSGYPDQIESSVDGSLIAKPFTPTTLLQKINELLPRA